MDEVIYANKTINDALPNSAAETVLVPEGGPEFRCRPDLRDHIQATDPTGVFSVDRTPF
jgi:hypothetical protein